LYESNHQQYIKKSMGLCKPYLQSHVLDQINLLTPDRLTSVPEVRGNWLSQLQRQQACSQGSHILDVY
jgi:hypothetical protein